ncbi:MAG: hypothetical protein ACI4P4_14800 [Faecousia sp.]
MKKIIDETYQADKLEFGGPSKRVIATPARTLVWQSPSNFGQTIVIQIVPTCRFPEFFHEKLYSYPGDCHASVSYFIAMTGNSSNSIFPLISLSTIKSEKILACGPARD